MYNVIARWQHDGCFLLVNKKASMNDNNATPDSHYPPSLTLFQFLQSNFQYLMLHQLAITQIT